MKRYKIVAIFFLIFSLGCLVYISANTVLIILTSFIFLEIGAILITKVIRSNFQWLITSNDQKPVLSKNKLDEFLIRGYDSELGWIRKPNTNGCITDENGKYEWNIDENGSRVFFDFEKSNSKISCYGDSYAFCSHVNDDETWEYYLSKMIQKNVLNFGVGNYGIDQAIIRLERDFHKNPTDIVILCVVPDTINRIHSMWKHYFEYGNTFAFKPRFIIEKNKIKIIKNPINKKEKLINYTEYLPLIQKYDYFYKNRFCKEIIKFPYLFHLLKHPKRNSRIIFWVGVAGFCKLMKINRFQDNWKAKLEIIETQRKWRIKLFSQKKSLELLIKLVEYYLSLSKDLNFKPILLIIPFKEDILFIKKNFHFYQDFLDKLKNNYNLTVLDASDIILKKENISELYSQQNEQGGHLSSKGNKLIASFVNDFLNKNNNWR